MKALGNALYLGANLFVGWALLTGCLSSGAHQRFYHAGERSLTNTDQLEQSSRQSILKSSQLRKTISSLHAEKRRSKDKQQQQQLLAQINQHKKDMSLLRHQGAQARIDSIKEKETALQYFQKGMLVRFQDWIDAPQQMRLAELAHQDDVLGQAHNPKVASVDPRVMNRMAADQAALRAAAKSSLIAQMLKEQSAPDDLDLSSFRISHKRQMIGHIEVHSSKAGSPEVPLNRIHQWRLVVSDVSGDPVDADFEVIGHMPGHVHGLPTAPQVTKQLAPGVYLIEGMKFQMRGWWVMEFATDEDRLRFDLVL